jgi:peroxiredoxin
VQFLGVAWRDSRDAMQAFVDRYGLEFPQLVDEDESIFARFDVPYQPAWAFISADGEVDMVFGPMSEDDLRATLEGLTG